jgi:hypothetical protein
MMATPTRVTSSGADPTVANPCRYLVFESSP